MARAGGESSEHFVAVAVLIGEFLSLFCLLLCIYCAMNEFECVCVCDMELSVQSFVYARAKLDNFELMYFHFQIYL